MGCSPIWYMMKERTKYCYFCDSQINKSVFREHQENHADVLETVRFSNDMKLACKSKCKICGKIEKINNMRIHTKSKHGMVITEYKEKFNQHYFDLVEKILHKCGVCEELLLLDSDCIAHHLSNNKATHGLTHAQYNAKFIVTMNNNIKNVDRDKNVKVVNTSSNISLKIKEKDSKDSITESTNHKKEDDYDKNYKQCYICNASGVSSNHMQTHEKELKLLRFSNDLNEQCRLSCDECGHIFQLAQMREHMKSKHTKDVGLHLLWQKLKPEEKVFHKCGICRKILLLDWYMISKHIRKHTISREEYKSKFLNKIDISEPSPTSEGFQNFLRRLSLPEYPTLVTMLDMRDSSKQVLLQTALRVCSKNKYNILYNKIVQ